MVADRILFNVARIPHCISVKSRSLGIPLYILYMPSDQIVTGEVDILSLRSGLNMSRRNTALLLLAQRFWRETVSLLDVMWPRSNQWERALLRRYFQPYNNRPLPGSKNPHLQNEAKCTTFLVKMSFIYMRMKTYFHIKGWALNLVLIQRPGELGNGLLRYVRY